MPSTYAHFRESKLTRLLQDSIGGNARTCLIATISPSRINAEESISTLKFADRAKQVMVVAVVNETRPVDHALVMRLQKEILHLRGMVAQMTNHMKQANISLPDCVQNQEDNIHQTDGTEESMTFGAEKFKKMEKENERLRRELAKYKARNVESVHKSPRQKPDLSYNDQDRARLAAQDACLSQVESIVRSLIGQCEMLWKSSDGLEDLINKFFTFVIEEDELKTDSTRIFRSLKSFRSENISDAAENLISSIQKLRAIDSLAAQSVSPNRASVVSTDISGYGAGHFSSNPSHESPYKQMKKSRSPFRPSKVNTVISSGSNISSESSVSNLRENFNPNTRHLPALAASQSSKQQFNAPSSSQSKVDTSQESMGGRQSSLPVMSSQYTVVKNEPNGFPGNLSIDISQDRDKRIPKAPNSISSANLSSKGSKGGSKRASRISSNGAVATAVAHTAAISVANGAQYSQRSARGHAPASRKKAFDAQRIYAAAAADLSGSNVEFRVRGSQDGDSWIAPVSEVKVLA